MQTWRGKNDSFEVSEATGTTSVVLPGIGLLKGVDAFVVETEFETWRVSLLKEAYGHIAMALIVRSSPDPSEWSTGGMETVWYLAPASAAELPEHLVGCDYNQIRAWLFDGLMDEHRIDEIDTISPRRELRPVRADDVSPDLIQALERALQEIVRTPITVDGPMLFAVDSATGVADNLNSTEVTHLALRAGIGVKQGESTGLVVLEVDWIDFDTREQQMLREGSLPSDTAAGSWLFLPAGPDEFSQLLCGSLKGVPMKSVQLTYANKQ